jgi:hypothetical protein
MPPPGLPTQPPSPTVAVFVGGRPATEVQVRSSERLSFLTPASDGGTVEVVVRNLDDTGVPLPGEEAILPAGFTYARPPLTTESDLTRLVRTLLRELKRQVIENVVLTVHTDFGAESGDELHLAEVASLPALVLVGPELVENRFYSLNSRPETPASPGMFARRRTPYTVDLGFTLVGASDHTVELLNLLAATKDFFHRNPFIEMERDASNPAAGRVRYELDVTANGDLKVTSQPNTSNLRSFSGAFTLRGFDFEELAGFPGDSVVARGARVDELALELSAPLAPQADGGRNS